MKLSFISSHFLLSQQCRGLNGPKGHRGTQKGSHWLGRSMTTDCDKNLVKAWFPLEIPKVALLKSNTCFPFLPISWLHFLREKDNKVFRAS